MVCNIELGVDILFLCRFNLVIVTVVVDLALKDCCFSEGNCSCLEAKCCCCCCLESSGC